jgi:hypothetical protein
MGAVSRWLPFFASFGDTMVAVLSAPGREQNKVIKSG